MIHNFIIMDRIDARKYSYKKHDEKSIIISINSCFCSKNNFKRFKENNILAILDLYFDDVFLHNIYSIQNKDIEAIVRFVDLWKDKADTLIVHCDVGVSRSAAVAACMKRYLGYDDWDIFKNPNYEPNSLVYNDIMKYIIKDYDINNKEDMNKFEYNKNLQEAYYEF